MSSTELITDILNAVKTLLENNFIKIGAVIFTAWVIEKIIRKYIGRIIKKAVKSHKYESRTVEKQREKTLTSILSTASAVVIWVITVILILAILQVDIAGLLAGAGLLGAAIAFAAQNSIKDFLSGIFIIAENQFRVGDVVTLANKTGVVEEISIRVTRLRDLDGNLHIVPNGIIDTVTNMTIGHSNVNLNIGVSYDTDIDKVKKIINEVGEELAKDKDFKDTIREPVAFLRVNSFDDSAVTIKALGEVVPGSQWDVAGEYRRRLKLAFDKNKIEIPFPQRVIHTVRDKGLNGQ